MNADVEKAVEVLTDHIADLNRCIGVFHAYPQMKAAAAEFAKATKELVPVVKALRDQDAEIARLKDAVMRKEGELSGALIKSGGGHEVLATKPAELLETLDDVIGWLRRRAAFFSHGGMPWGAMAAQSAHCADILECHRKEAHG